METTEERIIAILGGRGPLTSHELSEALGLEWTQFSTILLNMRRNEFNPTGPITTSQSRRGTLYYLVGSTPAAEETNL